GAHALKTALSPDMLATYETGARYHLMHALGLMVVGLVAERRPSRRVDAAGWLIAGGVVLFSGSLYALAITGNRSLGAITPLGGVSWIVGWIMLGLAVQAAEP
ncbi:MAG: DUF423 domain-containing protein, partial [Proteobacteria bacterium]|nr:DUF423 domain-containing protein [Pseudomonadota bacterium]